jgi:hypothetical protein
MTSRAATPVATSLWKESMWDSLPKPT